METFLMWWHAFLAKHDTAVPTDPETLARMAWDAGVQYMKYAEHYHVSPPWETVE